jgi:hypothetical protein
MKIRCLLILSIATFNLLNAQNVGINTNTPAYPLTVVVTSGTNPGIVQVERGGNAVLGIYTNTNSGAWLRPVSDHPLNFAVSNSENPRMKINYWGSVGIGTSLVPSDAYRLEVNGRMRIRHNSAANQTAGIWFDGTTLPLRSFLGTINDDHVGIWGNGGIGWNIAMNVVNGNMGFGTTAPTKKVDVNGSLRFRGVSSKKGSMLISIDANGNATWQEPVAFKAYGSADGEATYISSNWVSYQFSTAPEYNIGLHYNANTSEFVAPVDGLYHFDAAVAFQQKNSYYGIRLNVSSTYGYGYSVAPYKLESNGTDPFGYGFEFEESPAAANTSHIASDIPLRAGDKVSVRVYRSPNSDYINPDIRRTWFSGHFVSRL